MTGVQTCALPILRPFLLTEEEVKNAPEGFKTKKAVGKGLENYAKASSGAEENSHTVDIVSLATSDMHMGW